MNQFSNSSFGVFLMVLFENLLTVKSEEKFMILSYGWSMARGRFYVSTFIWLSGGTAYRHFSRYYYFLGGGFYKAREKFWGAVVRFAERFVPEDQPIRLKVDDENQKCTGRKIEGAAYYRNGAGTARQEYRTLFGLNFVHAVMSVPVPLLPGHFISIPVGLELYLKKPQAEKLKRDYAFRSTLARKIIDFVAETLPERQIQVSGDGGYATKDFLRDRQNNIEVVSRMMISGKLYEAPPARPSKKHRGRPPSKGKLIGSPKTLVKRRKGWKKHPWETGAEIQSFIGMWHSVLPGRQLKVIVVRRQNLPKGSKRKEVEAFFTTDITMTDAQLLTEFHSRWDIEIDIRDGNEFYGIGKNQCRKYERIVGANTFCSVMASARTLWFIDRLSKADSLDLLRHRPWYRQKKKPSQLDITWALTECLNAERIFPTVRFLQDLQENSPKSQEERSNAA